MSQLVNANTSSESRHFERQRPLTIFRRAEYVARQLNKTSGNEWVVEWHDGSAKQFSYPILKSNSVICAFELKDIFTEFPDSFISRTATTETETAIACCDN